MKVEYLVCAGSFAFPWSDAFTKQFEQPRGGSSLSDRAPKTVSAYCPWSG